VQAGATGTFSRVLPLLEAAAAGPGTLGDELARAEQVLAARQVELATAQVDVEAAEADAVRTEADASATEVLVVRLEGLPEARVPEARESRPGPNGPPTLTTVRQLEGVAPASPATQRHELAIQLEWKIRAAEAAAQRAAAARQVRADRAAAVDAARRPVEQLREQVWSKLNDPTFATAARVLVAGTNGQQVAPSALARTDVPPAALDLYRQAASTCPGLSWTVLAAIGSIESNHGRSTAPGVRTGANFAGAMGPMQFLAATWAGYGLDGNGDGNRNVYDPADAVPGAANYLCANGAGVLSHLADALWAYNHAGWYVDDVLVLALRYGSDGLAPTGGAPAADALAVLTRPSVALSAEARSDLLAGRVDPRVVRMLTAASTGHRIAVSVIETGHSMLVAGTDRVSNHYLGRAVDIYAVDGVGVSPTNNAALELALAVLTTAPDLRPDELGSPWPELGAFPGAFSDAGHADHLHLGWGP
jgi:hypothetical protein